MGVASSNRSAIALNIGIPTMLKKPSCNMADGASISNANTFVDVDWHQHICTKDIVL